MYSMEVTICPRLIEKMIKSGKGNMLVNVCQPSNPQLYSWNDSYNIIGSAIPLGVYAVKNYMENDIVHIMSGKLTTEPTKLSIHIGDNMHLTDNYGKFINHSFEPTVKVVGNKLIAIKYINKYDEITFNYNDSEINMSAPFEDDGINVCGQTK